jgi:hypothetical protein
VIPRGASAPLELLADLRRGEPVSHVARRYGVAPRRARQWASEHCIPVVRGRPLQTTITREQAIAAVREHGSCHAAALALGCSWPTIARRVRAW